MLRDLKLWVSKKIRQQITCNHDYHIKHAHVVPEFDYYECSKCGKWKGA